MGQNNHTFLRISVLLVFLRLTSYYPLVVAVESYGCTCSHSDTHILGMTPLDEGSARRRDLYLTTHNIHKRQTSMHPAGLETEIPETDLDCVVTGIDQF